MRIIKPVFFLLVLLMLSALNAQAQECGGAFNTVKVSDSKGMNIRGAIIELVAQLPKEEYKDLTYGNGKFIKMSVPNAEAAIKQNLPIGLTEDIFCKNPLKQYAGITKVKKLGELQQRSIENLGFCTGEVISTPFILKVSAPGYLTDYYAANFLGGCGNIYEFVLTEKKRKVRRKKKLV